jgi:purine nucleoside permease
MFCSTSTALAQLLEQAAHAGRVDLYAQIVVMRMCGRDFGRGFAHAEADFKNFRRVTAEQLLQIQCLCAVRHAVQRQQLVMRALLRVGHTALAQHVAADGSLGIGHGPAV